jgi:cytoskeletal protein CcmA (bactofilin family)
VRTPRLRSAPTDAAPSDIRAGTQDIFIGEGMAVEASFETTGAVYVDGCLLNSRVRASRLSIGPGGTLSGEAVVDSADIAGRFIGRLTASDELILRSSAVADGDFSGTRLMVHRGARVLGRIVTTAGIECGEAGGRRSLADRPETETPRRFLRGRDLFGTGALVAASGLAVLFALCIVAQALR